MSDNNNFGTIFRELRERLSAGLRGIAAEAGMDPAYLSRVETGTIRPKRETVERLASALCAQDGVGEAACREMRRALLDAAGHPLPHDEVLDSLEDQFAALLRSTHQLGEVAVRSALEQVPLATMRRVLAGEEDLEIGNPGDYTASEIEARRGAGEDVVDLFPREDPREASPTRLSVQQSATDYLAETERIFRSESAPPRRAKADGSPGKPRRGRGSKSPFPAKPTRISAGPEAEIVLSRRVGPRKREQLRTIARLIASLMREETEEDHAE
jgi:transcriptional regulator with XRE-family HTH domain